MTKKVTVPKEVAEAIEILRGKDLSNWNIIDQAEGAIFDYYPLILKRWAFDEDGAGTPDELMSALVNGYEVERTPHEELAGEYGFAIARSVNSDYYDGIAHGIGYAVNTLGIVVEGINAK